MREERAPEQELMKVRGEIADIERALKNIQAQHAERGEHRPEFRAQIEKLEGPVNVCIIYESQPNTSSCRGA